MADHGLAALISDSEPSPWETKPPGEDAAIQTIAELVKAQVLKTAAGGKPRRDAHPKMHGCVSARLEVLHGLPDALREGLFETPRTYAAWVRFSNGSSTPQGDAADDGRGMAIKVMGVEASRSGTQDFVMINAPAFFVRNAADYVDFSRAVHSPLKFFFPSLNPFKWRLHELLAGRAISQRQVPNPLDAQYFTMAPLLFGDTPCKVSARPVGAPSAFADRTAPDFLRDNLAKALAEGDKVFELCVQLRVDNAMPVEDPTIVWSEARSPFLAVARLTIPRQVFATPERDAFGENLSFTPWHGLDAHRPLGGINRVRRLVYETISALRHQGAPRQEPTADPPGA
jgi:hypothetical protein